LDLFCEIAKPVDTVCLDDISGWMWSKLGLGVYPASGKGAMTEDGQSAMRNYKEVLTIQQLIDLVALLQSQYELEHFTPSIRPHYSHPWHRAAADSVQAAALTN
jgi:predicted RNase H-like nuclease